MVGEVARMFDSLKAQSPCTLYPKPRERSLSANQGRGITMDCPLTNQGPYTVTNRIGTKRARKSSQSNLSRSLPRPIT